MKKRRITKILIEGKPEFLQKLATQVEDRYQIRIERKPKTGLVMLKTRDSVSKQPFFIGEMLVTDCTVSIKDTVGVGVIKGEEFERSYQLAVVDAAFNAHLPLIDDWLPELADEEREIEKRHVQHDEKVAKTKVHFHTMEDYYDKS